eukprot:EG_transcript_62572
MEWYGLLCAKQTRPANQSYSANGVVWVAVCKTDATCKSVIFGQWSGMGCCVQVRCLFMPGLLGASSSDLDTSNPSTSHRRMLLQGNAVGVQGEGGAGAGAQGGTA